MLLAGWGFPKLLLVRLSGDPALSAVRGGRGTLLHAAAEGGHRATAKVLLLFGADRTATDDHGQTPSDLAALKGYGELSELLR
jgi:ankyrin repeat protein